MNNSFVTKLSSTIYWQMPNYYTVVQNLSGFSSEYTYPTIAYFRFFRKGKGNISNKVFSMLPLKNLTNNFEVKYKKQTFPLLYYMLEIEISHLTLKWTTFYRYLNCNVFTNQHRWERHHSNHSNFKCLKADKGQLACKHTNELMLKLLTS